MVVFSGTRTWKKSASAENKRDFYHSELVNRPHSGPCRLLITFMNLTKNKTFKFCSHEFVHCAPDIQKLFESVFQSCMVTTTQPRQEHAAYQPATAAE